jgi:hypothetical protein
VGLNPEHPFWVPEFEGDVICVNGKVWPKLTVANKRYAFWFLNGSNARTYNMFLVDQVSKNFGPPIWVIGTDGGLLDTPVKLDPAAAANNSLTMMPGERYLAVIDFAGYEAGVVGPNGAAYSGSWLLKNNAKTPFPAGGAPGGPPPGASCSSSSTRPARCLTKPTIRHSVETCGSRWSVWPTPRPEHRAPA